MDAKIQNWTDMTNLIQIHLCYILEYVMWILRDETFDTGYEGLDDATSDEGR